MKAYMTKTELDQCQSDNLSESSAKVKHDKKQKKKSKIKNVDSSDQILTSDDNPGTIATLNPNDGALVLSSDEPFDDESINDEFNAIYFLMESPAKIRQKYDEERFDQCLNLLLLTGLTV